MSVQDKTGTSSRGQALTGAFAGVAVLAVLVAVYIGIQVSDGDDKAAAPAAASAPADPAAPAPTEPAPAPSDPAQPPAAQTPLDPGGKPGCGQAYGTATSHTRDVREQRHAGFPPCCTRRGNAAKVAHVIDHGPRNAS